MSFGALSELALSEASAPRALSGTLAVSLDGLTVSLVGGFASKQVPAGAVGKGWAWVGDRMVYGTQQDVERAIREYQASQRVEAPKPRKVKKAKKLGELPRVEPVIEVPLIDWLGGVPDIQAYEAQAEVYALIERMRLAEIDDEEAVLLSL